MGRWILGDGFWRAGCDDVAAVFACVGSEVDDPVCAFDDVEVVLYDEDGVAAVNEAVEDFDEDADVVKVQSRGGFVEEIKRFARGGSRKFGCEFDALCLAAREGCGWLTEAPNNPGPRRRVI